MHRRYGAVIVRKEPEAKLQCENEQPRGSGEAHHAPFLTGEHYKIKREVKMVKMASFADRPKISIGPSSRSSLKMRLTF